MLDNVCVLCLVHVILRYLEGLLVRLCLYLVGTHESMFSCMNMSVSGCYLCVFVGLVSIHFYVECYDCVCVLWLGTC